MATSKERKLVESKSTTAVVRVYSQELVTAFVTFMATLKDSVELDVKVNENDCVVFVIFEKSPDVNKLWSLTMIANRNTELRLNGDLTFMGVEHIRITPILKYEDIVNFVKRYCNLLLDVWKHNQTVKSKAAVGKHITTRQLLIARCRKVMREAEANDVEHKAAVKEVEAILEKATNHVKAMTAVNKLNS
jgi:hypothetical protein